MSSNGNLFTDSLRYLQNKDYRTNLIIFIFVQCIVAALFIMERYGRVNFHTLYMPAHMLLETFSMFFCLIVFILGWNAYTCDRPRNIVIISSFFLAVGLIDFLHMLSYKGMPFFITENNPHKAIIFWQTARYIMALVLLAVVVLPWKPLKHMKSRYYYLAASVGLVPLAAWIGLFHEDWVPNTFVEGVGLTSFKIVSEILILLLYLFTLLLLIFGKIKTVQKSKLFMSLMFMVLSEMCFSLYTDVTDAINFTGHLYKIAACYFIYRWVLEDSVHIPYSRLVHAERALIVNQERALTIFNGVSDAVVLTDSNHNILNINQAALKIARMDKGEVIGKPFEKVFALEQDLRFASLSSLGCQTGQLATGSGERIPIEYSVSPIVNDAGKWSGNAFFFRDMTERIETDRTEQRFASILEHVSDLVITITPDGDVLYANRKARGLQGGETPASDPVHVGQFYAEEARDRLLRTGIPAAAAKGMWEEEQSAMLDANHGEIAIAQVAIADPDPIWNHDYYSIICRDLTENKRSQEERELAIKVFENVSEGITITDADTNVLYVNAAFQKLTGYEQDEIVGKTPRILSSGWHKPDFYQQMWDSIEESGSWYGEIWNKHKNGELYLAGTTITAVMNESGETTHYLSVMKDYTVQKQLEAQISFHTNHDSMTDLPNWSLLQSRFDLATPYALKNERIVCVMVVDLDHFKKVNDSWGRSAGNSLLKEAAERLVTSVRASDTVSRLEGDQFAILLPDLRSRDDSYRIADQMKEKLSMPFVIDGKEISVTSSIGICFSPDHGDNLDTLIGHAQIALHHAKLSGRNHYQVYL